MSGDAIRRCIKQTNDDSGHRKSEQLSNIIVRVSQLTNGLNFN